MTDVQQSLLADCCAFFFVSSGKSIIFADGFKEIMPKKQNCRMMLLFVA